MNQIQNSEAYKKIRPAIQQGNPPRIAFIDIDDTLTGDVVAVRKVRNLLDAANIPLVLITSRTEEMVMSTDSYNHSKKALLGGNYPRLQPHLKRTKNGYVYVKVESVIPSVLLDPDIVVAATGTQIYVRQSSGEYKKEIGYTVETKSNNQPWRDRILLGLEALKHKGVAYQLSAIDEPQAYQNGHVDVALVEYRIQLGFKSKAQKVFFMDAIKKSAIEKHVKIMDDSNPRFKQFQLYLTPKRASKAHAAEYIVNGFCEALNCSRADMQLFFAGDSYQDLEMGFTSCLSSPALFTLVSGSRMKPFLAQSRYEDFAGSDLSQFKKKMLGGQGRYRISTNKKIDRRMILGDAAFPKVSAPESVYLSLQEFLK